jgi:hypothetical protein
VPETALAYDTSDDDDDDGKRVLDDIHVRVPGRDRTTNVEFELAGDGPDTGDFECDAAYDDDGDVRIHGSDDDHDVRAALFVEEEPNMRDLVVQGRPPALDEDARRNKKHRAELWDSRDEERLMRALDEKLGHVDWTEDPAMIRAVDKIFRYRILAYGGEAQRAMHPAWAFFVAFADGRLHLPSSSANTTARGLWCCVLCARSETRRLPLFWYDGNASHMHRHISKVHNRELSAYVNASGTDYRKTKARQSIKHGSSRIAQAKTALRRALSDAPEEADDVKVQRVQWLLTAWTMNKGLPVHVPTEEIFSMVWFEACGNKLPNFTKKKVEKVMMQWESIAVKRTNAELARAEFVSLSFDLWMTSAGRDVFALLAHFTVDATHVSRVLCVVDNQSLTSEEMQGSIVDSAKVFTELRGKVVALISDQGRNVQAVQKALMRDELGIFHPMALRSQLLCAAHRFSTIMRHAMENLKPLPLYPPVDTPVAHNLEPRAQKKVKNGKPDNGRSEADSGYFGVTVFTFGDLTARLNRCALFLHKSSVARREFKDLALALDGKNGEFKLEYDDATPGKPKVVPKTRFVYYVQMLEDALSLRSKMQAAFEAETTAANKARLTTWQSRDIITPASYTVIDRMYQALRLIGSHTTLAQASQHYSFCDVGLVALIARVHSARDAAQAKIRRREIEQNSSVEKAIPLWVERAAVTATEELSSTIERRLTEEFEGLHEYAATAARGKAGGCKVDEVCKSMLASLFLHPVVWYAPELHDAITGEARDNEDTPFRVSEAIQRFMSAIWDDVLCDAVTQGAVAVDAAGETPRSIDDVIADVVSDTFDVDGIWGFSVRHDGASEKLRTRQTVEGEAQLYISTVMAKRATHVDHIHAPASLPQRPDTDTTIVQWWRAEFARTKLPLLSRYARMMFDIPQTQCDCERVFSFLGRLSKGNRANTSMATLQRLARVNSSIPPDVMYSIARHGLESVPTVSATTFSVDASPATQESVGYDHERASQHRMRADAAAVRAQHNSERSAQEVQEALRGPANAFAAARHAENSAAQEDANAGAIPTTPVRRSSREKKKSRRNGTTPGKTTATEART